MSSKEDKYIIPQNNKKYNTSHYQRAFTIVELLIVIVVIAILAAIVIVAYNGVRSQAVDSSMKSDLASATKQLENDKTLTGSYPVDAPSANGGAGLKMSGSNTLVYTPKSYGFCLSITNPSSQRTWIQKSTTGTVVEGVCEATVSTLAGSGVDGFANGSGAVAQFSYQLNVAVDSTGTVYVADGQNHRIRKVSPSGVVTTFAGSGVAGFANGTGAAAQFNYPAGLAVDLNGNVYVADTVNNQIRKITPGGVVSTLAGSTTPGYEDAGGGAARFIFPYDVAVDTSGTVYVADYGNQRIREVSSSGVVTTLAGSGDWGDENGPAESAQFNNPYGIAVDNAGNVYVADNNNHRVRKITPAGNVSTLAGSTQGFANATGAAARFDDLTDVAVDAAGRVYVADGGNGRIRLISPSGVVTTFAGSGDFDYLDGEAAVAQFNYPMSVTLSSTGEVYVGDADNFRIRKIVP